MSCLMKHKFDNNCAVYMRINDDEHEPLPGTYKEQASKLLRNIYGWDTRPCDWEMVLEKTIGLPDLVIIDDIYVWENFAFKAPSKEYPFPLTEVSHKFVKGENRSVHDDIIYIVKEKSEEVVWRFGMRNSVTSPFSIAYDIKLPVSWQPTPISVKEIYSLIIGGLDFPEILVCDPMQLQGRREEGLSFVLTKGDLRKTKMIKIRYSRGNQMNIFFVKIPACFPLVRINLNEYIANYLWIRYGYDKLIISWEFIEPCDPDDDTFPIDWDEFINTSRKPRGDVKYYYDNQKECYYRRDMNIQPHIFIPNHCEEVPEVYDIAHMPTVVPSYKLITFTFDAGLGIPPLLTIMKTSRGGSIETFLNRTIPEFIYLKYGKKVEGTNRTVIATKCNEGDAYEYTEDDILKIIEQMRPDNAYKGSCTNCKKLGKFIFELPYCKLCENKDLWEAKE